MTSNKLYKAAYKEWGLVPLLIKLSEECGELIQASSKCSLGKGDRLHLAEECADVQIMVEQIIVATQIKKDVRYYRAEKLKKLENKLKE